MCPRLARSRSARPGRSRTRPGTAAQRPAPDASHRPRLPQRISKTCRRLIDQNTAHLQRVPPTPTRRRPPRSPRRPAPRRSRSSSSKTAGASWTQRRERPPHLELQNNRPFSIENHHFQGKFSVIFAFSIENSETSWHLYCNSHQSFCRARFCPRGHLQGGRLLHPRSP